MKILFISPVFPFSGGSGSEIRSHQIYAELKSFATVDVLSSHFLEIDEARLAQFREQHSHLGHIKVPRFFPFFLKNRALDDKLKRILVQGNYDFIVVRYYITAFGLGLFGHSRLVLDCDDCGLELMAQFLRKQREARHFALVRWAVVGLHYLGYRKLYRSNLARAHSALFAKASSRIEWRHNFHLLPNRISQTIVPARGTPADADQIPPKVLFVGLLAYPANFEGVDHFVDHIWPAVRRSVGNAVFKIVGGGLPPHLRTKWSTVAGIELCGFVKDIEAVYGDVLFSVSPVYQGSGTHIKVMESLLRGKTMVVTPMSHRGYEQTLVDGESILVAHTDARFSDLIVQLLQQPQWRAQLGASGRESVLKNHTTENSVPILNGLLQAAFTGAQVNPLPGPVDVAEAAQT